MKTIILGAGPSGLGVAWGLSEMGHRDILVVEKASQVGGLSGSFRVGQSILDYGPHRFSPEYPELVRKIRELLGNELLEQPNEHAVRFKGRFYRYPPRLLDFLHLETMWHGTRAIASFFKERMLSRLRALGMKFPVERTFPGIIKGRFGRYLYQEIVYPMCAKVWGDPNRLDPEFANLRFSVPTIVQWAKKMIHTKDTFNDKVFYYPRKGFQQLWERIVEKLRDDGNEVWCDAQVTAIKTDGTRVVSATIVRNGVTHEVPVNYLVSTIPTQHFLRLLKPSPVPTSELLTARFQNRGMLLCYFLLKKERALPARVVIFPEQRYVFNRLSEQNQFSRETVPAGHSAIVADILCDVNSAEWNDDDSRVLALVEEQLKECGVIDGDEKVESQLFRVPIAYPLPTVERENEQSRFNKIFRTMENVLVTGRFASSDYNNCHTALKKGLLAAKSIDSKKQVAEWYELAEGIRKIAIRD